MYGAWGAFRAHSMRACIVCECSDVCQEFKATLEEFDDEGVLCIG